MQQLARAALGLPIPPPAAIVPAARWFVAVWLVAVWLVAAPIGTAAQAPGAAAAADVPTSEVPPDGFEDDLVEVPPEHGLEGTITSVHEVPFALEPLEGVAVFASVLGPPAGATVWHTELHVSWEPSHSHSADELLVVVGAQHEDGGWATWTVTGEAFGFDSAPGAQSGTVQTDDLNGTLVVAPYAGTSVLDLQVTADAGTAWGALLDARFVFHLGPRLAASTDSLSLSTGGAQELALNAGPIVGPGLPYLVFGSASPAAPPATVAGPPLPFALDDYTLATVARANSGPFQATFGLLDHVGRAQAAIVLPRDSDPALAGVVLHHAFAVLAEDLSVLGYSNVVALELAL